MNTHSPAYTIIAAILRVALLLALGAAVWNIYQKLPVDDRAVERDDARGQNPTTLVIELRPAPEERDAPLDIPVELYPVDIAAVRREYQSELRAGMRFDDFLSKRMNGRVPIKARLDPAGQATVMVPPGKWWIHATLAGTLNVEWRLPVNIAGRKQTAELTLENAYARTKSF
ncbi:MAG: hypothetical protein WCF57_21445 [Pyrinomonadaceae bacterium]